MIWLLWIAAAYLLGAVPFSYLVVRLVYGQDVRSVGSGNPGATNTLRAAGPLPAATVLLLDVAKGAAPVWGAAALGAPPAAVGGAGLAATLGHVFPVYLRFRGGKGVATALGVLGVLASRSTLAAVGLFVIVVAWKRYVSLGSLVLVVSVPLLMPLFSRLGWEGPVEGAVWLAAAAIALLVTWRHTGNIRRLLAGRERRLGDSAGAVS
ncbi:MAG: glycerol-3-phosphate 1-O-acyltransferase PlsY [Thermoanaerobaculia bacterium]|nr:glycerol-3-phosphate 1-O-acyltransferase PlsY [Thermoanaerobaculia bacterium]